MAGLSLGRIAGRCLAEQIGDGVVLGSIARPGRGAVKVYVVDIVRRKVCATAALDTSLAEAVERRLGAPLYEIYGCSEVGQVAVRRTVETAEWTCLDGIVLREQDGEVWASGDSAAANMPLNDVIELRSPTRFALHGRKSDLINIAGKRCSLSYLNFHLNRIGGVQDGVFVAPGEGQTRLTAYVVAPSLSAEVLRAALRPHVDAAFLPRPIHFVDALPRNSLGKLTQAALEQLDVKIQSL